MKIDEAINSKFKNDHHRAIVNLKYTANWIDNCHNKNLAPYGLSVAQFNILRILRGAKSKLSVKVVKERMIEKSPNTTRLMDKLIDKDFVQRERCDDDRRVVYVAITDAGQEILKRIDVDFESIINYDVLTTEEAITLSTLLDKLRG